MDAEREKHIREQMGEFAKPAKRTVCDCLCRRCIAVFRRSPRALFSPSPFGSNSPPL